MYYLFIVVLEHCPYSINAVQLLDKHKIKYKKLTINSDDKEKYKTSEIQTFPQIYLKKTPSNDSLLLGGFDDLKLFMNMFVGKEYSEINIKEFQSKYTFWSKKPILKLIEIINI